MARLRASWRTSLPVVQQPRNPQSESIARSPYEAALCVPKKTSRSLLARAKVKSSCNGPCCVKSLSDRHVAEFVLLFVVSAGLPYHAIREETASPSRAGDPVRRDRSRHYVRLHRFRRPGDGTSGAQGQSLPAPNCSSSLPALRRRDDLPAPAEGRPIHPH